LDLDKIAGDLLALSAITEDEYFNFKEQPFVDDREFMYSYINSLQNTCTICDRHKYRKQPIEGSYLPGTKLPNIVFVSDHPSYLDTVYGADFVNLEKIYKEHPNTLNSLKSFKMPLTIAKDYPEIDLECKDLNIDINFWQEQPGHLGPFYSPGQVFRYLTSEVGLVEDDFLIEYLVRCPKYTASSSAPVSKKDLTVCMKWLKLKLSIVQPKIVVTLGKDAASVFLSKEVDLDCGEIVQGEHSFDVLPTPHPASPFYKMSNAEQIIENMLFAYRKLNLYK
jgi:uracil-DNA glycosylase family 4